MNSITCRVCQTQNPDGYKFCHNCGAPLKALTHITCANCYHANPVHAIYCDQCGNKLQKSTQAEPSDADTKGEPTSNVNQPFSLPAKRPGETGDLDPDKLPDWLREHSDFEPLDSDEQASDQPEITDESILDSAVLFPSWLSGDEPNTDVDLTQSPKQGTDWLSVLDINQPQDQDTEDEPVPELPSMTFETPSTDSDLNITDWLSSVDPFSSDGEDSALNDGAEGDDSLSESLRPDWMADEPVKGFELTEESLTEFDPSEHPPDLPDFDLLSADDEVELESDLESSPRAEAESLPDGGSGLFDSAYSDKPVDPPELMNEESRSPDPLGIEFETVQPATKSEEGDHEQEGLFDWLTADEEPPSINKALFEPTEEPLAFTQAPDVSESVESSGLVDEVPFLDSLQETPLSSTELEDDWLDSLGDDPFSDSSEQTQPVPQQDDQAFDETLFDQALASAAETESPEVAYYESEEDLIFSGDLRYDVDLDAAHTLDPLADFGSDFEDESPSGLQSDYELAKELGASAGEFASDEDDAFFGELVALGQGGASQADFALEGAPEWIKNGSKMVEPERFKEAGGPLDELKNVIPLAPIIVKPDGRPFVVPSGDRAKEVGRAELSAWRGTVNETLSERTQPVPRTAVRPKPTRAKTISTPQQRREALPVPEESRSRSYRGLAIFLLVVFFLYFLYLFSPVLYAPFAPFIQTAVDLFNQFIELVSQWLP